MTITTIEFTAEGDDDAVAAFCKALEGAAKRLAKKHGIKSGAPFTDQFTPVENDWRARAD